MGVSASQQFDWTDARVAQLKQLAAVGAAAPDIAATLGINRNAVLGKIYRLGLAKRKQSVWTDERVSALKKLWGDRLTAKQIGKMIGTTKSAVFKKATRLGLTSRWTPTEKAARSDGTQRMVKPRGALSGVRAKMRQANDTSKALPLLPDELPREAIPVEQRRTLLELTPVTCRWPYGDPGTPSFFFCGSLEADLTESRPYCSFHANLARGAHTPRRVYASVPEFAR